MLSYLEMGVRFTIFALSLGVGVLPTEARWPSDSFSLACLLKECLAGNSDLWLRVVLAPALVFLILNWCLLDWISTLIFKSFTKSVQLLSTRFVGWAALTNMQLDFALVFVSFTARGCLELIPVSVLGEWLLFVRMDVVPRLC